jgi:Mannosylglycerate hydrolase MGH1-like glycoside hydrolase domain
MSDWILKEGDPISLKLVADARMCTLDFLDDQIWELNLGEGDPPAISAWTTYGLRALGMRIFIRFREGTTVISAPESFWRPITVRKIFPNYLLLAYSPLPGIDAIGEYWVPQNKVLAGRIELSNSGVTPRSIQVELISILHPVEGGERMAPARIQEVSVLTGRSANLSPVVFLTGGSLAALSPFPSLSVTARLLPGQTESWIWVQTALEDPQDSFNLAREIASRSWESESARIELENASQIDIISGNPDWDRAFTLGQQAALSLVHGPGSNLPYHTFVSTRTPDQGYSLRGDGLDYDHLWSGQTPLDTLYLSHTLLWSAPSLVVGFLKNLLYIQQLEGQVDWKPGMAGQRSNLLATPVLAHIAWSIYQLLEDREFIEEVYPGLCQFFLDWLKPEHDRDGDGVPEWDNVMQSGIEDHPSFSSWFPGSPAVNISTSETPSLNAFLYKECQALIKIARLLAREDDCAKFEQIAMNLRKAAETGWSTKLATYQYLDRDSHQPAGGSWTLALNGKAARKLRKRFKPARRLNIAITTTLPEARAASISLKGKDLRGRAITENLNHNEISWSNGMGIATTKFVYENLSEITVDGLEESDRIRLSITDYSCLDLTLLLPLWAGIPKPRRAAALIKRMVIDPDRYERPFGLPIVPKSQQIDTVKEMQAVHIPWNALIAEGVLSYGFRREAAQILNSIMEGIIQNFRRYKSFRSPQHCETGEGIGERNTLRGLPPLGLFLETLGVHIISPWKVALEGANPFPWPVEVQYRGLRVSRGLEQTIVTFPDGEIVEIDDPTNCIVER